MLNCWTNVFFWFCKHVFFTLFLAFLVAGPRRGRCVAVGSEQRAASSEQRAASCEQRAASKEHKKKYGCDQRAARSDQRAASSEQRAASTKLCLLLSKTMVFRERRGAATREKHKTLFRKTELSYLTAFLKGRPVSDTCKTMDLVEAKLQLCRLHM